MLFVCVPLESLWGTGLRSLDACAHAFLPLMQAKSATASVNGR